MRRVVNGELVDLPLHEVEIHPTADRLVVRSARGVASALAVRRGEDVLVSYRGQTFLVEPATRTRARGGPTSGELRAPMPGAIVDVLVNSGHKCQKGDKIVVLEAMKTQQPLVAPFDGVVAKINVQKGDQVADGQVLAVVEPEANG